MRTSEFLLLISALICAVRCEVFYEEKFSDGKLEIIDLCGHIDKMVIFLWVENVLAGFLNGKLLRSFTDSWQDKWTYSEHPGKEFGKFERTAGKFFNDEEADKGKCDVLSV